MNTLIIVIAMIGLLFVLVSVQLFISQKRKARQFIETLHLVSTLKKLIGLSQRHRGLSATYLQGNQSVSSDIHSVRNAITGYIRSVRESDILTTEARWESYLDHWNRLESASLTLSPAESFKQHTSMIETLLYLLQDIAEHLEFADTQHQLADAYFLWREFPQLVEYIGQARAVGVATATKGESTQIDKVKLGYLCEKINTISASVFAKLHTYAQVVSTSELNAGKDACTQLISIIDNELIKHDTVTIESQFYFETASKTMDQCNALLDSELSRLIATA